jgi:hypothetical protein
LVPLYEIQKHFVLYLRLKLLTQRFLEDKDMEGSSLNVGADMRKINFCFKFIKELYLQVGSKSKMLALNNLPANNSNNINSNSAPNITIVDSSHYDSKETKELKETLKQRDHEISILVSMLKKEKKRNADGYAFDYHFYNNIFKTENLLFIIFYSRKPPSYGANANLNVDASNDDFLNELRKNGQVKPRQICK